MKKIYFIVSILFYSATFAQIINIPDANFKFRLLTAHPTYNPIAAIIDANGNYSQWTTIDTNGDGEIEVAEAQLINYLNININSGSSGAISDITGLEYFTNLDWLKCSGNNLTNINLTNLTNLKYLECNNNLLTNINLNPLVNLINVRCYGNNISSLDFSNSPHLESVNCGENLITELDFHNNPTFYDLGCGNSPLLSSVILKNGVIQNTNYGIYQCDGFFNCPNLQFICVDENEQALVQQLLDNMLNWGGPQNVICNSNCNLNTTNFSVDNLLIYPNPAIDIVNISSDNIKDIEFIDLQGRIIMSKSINENQATLDVSAYSKGIYYIKVITDKFETIKKFIKE